MAWHFRHREPYVEGSSLSVRYRKDTVRTQKDQSLNRAILRESFKGQSLSSKMAEWLSWMSERRTFRVKPSYRRKAELWPGQNLAR
jgi:hypothetical protein